MAMGQMLDEGTQGELFVTSADLPQSPGHVFYEKLNSILDKAGFDRFIESQCQPYYDNGSRGGRPGIPPGVYFRMLFIGYFEGIDSQRGIAWRCKDSLSLRAFLSLAFNEPSPDHSSLTNIRRRLPLSVHESVFRFVLKLCADCKLLSDPSVVGVDSTTLEANAALRSIVRRDTNASYPDYVRGLMQEEGKSQQLPASDSLNPPLDTAPQSSPSVRASDSKNDPPTPLVEPPTPPAPWVPTQEEVIRFDRKRKGKTLSNADWKSPVDADARIAKMKDGRTRLAYKSEHVIDLKSEVILATAIYPADYSDHETLTDSVMEARMNLAGAGLQEMSIDCAASDKGYHNRPQLTLACKYGVQTYVAEPERKGRQQWADVPAEERKIVEANRRRAKGKRGRSLQRRRSEVVERSFAHMCETGGSRRSWLRGIPKVVKRYSMAAAARNLGLVMRKIFGIGKPRVMQSVEKAENGGGGHPTEGAEGLLHTLFNHLRSLSARLTRKPKSLRVAFSG
jgi:transposase